MGYVVRRVHASRSRRLKKTARVGTALIALLVVVAGAWLLVSHQSESLSSDDVTFNASGDSGQSLASLAAQQALSQSGPSRRSVRVVYPYSIVPGGVRDARELQNATAHDPVAARHYAGFDFQKAHLIEVDQPKFVYVSYRLHDKVYWTKKKISLHKGERLLTDGKTTARTRCGNQVSEQAKNAVSPDEPPAERFEDPYLADGGTAMQAPFPKELNSAVGRHFDGLGFGEQEPPPLSGSNLYGAQGGQGFAPLFPPPLPAAGCEPNSVELGENGSDDESKETVCPPGPPRPPGPPVGPVPGSGPPATVPEPGTLALVASGLAGVLYRYRKSNR